MTRVDQLGKASQTDVLWTQSIQSKLILQDGSWPYLMWNPKAKALEINGDKKAISMQDMASSLAAAPTTPLPRQCHPLSRDEIGQAGPPSHPVETGAECSNGCFSSGSAPTVPQCGLAAGMLPSPAQRIATEQVGRRTPEDSEAPMMMVANSAAIMAQIMTDGPQQMASWVLANLDATQLLCQRTFCVNHVGSAAKMPVSC